TCRSNRAPACLALRRLRATRNLRSPMAALPAHLAVGVAEVERITALRQLMAAVAACLLLTRHRAPPQTRRATVVPGPARLPSLAESRASAPRPHSWRTPARRKCG